CEASDHAAVLHELDDLDGEPDRQRPGDAAPARAGQLVEGFERGFAGADGVLAELELDDDLNGAAYEDDPERDEPGRRAEGGGHDEFAGAYDVCREDQRRADALERSPQ